MVPAIAVKYGDRASAAAADWYELMRAKWFEPGYETEAAPPFDDVPMRQTIRRLAGHLWGGKDGTPADPETMLRGLLANMDRWVKQPARDTIVRNARRDRRKPRYARVPQGPTCGFCIMLASRGFVYSSAEAAGGDMNDYHNDCDCEPIPSWDKKNPKIEGYDPDRLFERYKACRATIESLLTEERYRKTYRDVFVPRYEGDEPKTFDQWVARQIAAEMDWRDRQWLFDGTEPDITFETPQLEQQIRKEHPQEIDTAKRLRELGVPPHFVVDTETYFDEEKGIEQTRGLADWEGGIEIKTLLNTGSRNTINAHLKDASGKRNAIRVIFDNTDNKALTDDGLKEILSSSRRFKQGMIYMLSKDQKLIRIR